MLTTIIETLVVVAMLFGIAMYLFTRDQMWANVAMLNGIVLGWKK